MPTDLHCLPKEDERLVVSPVSDEDPQSNSTQKKTLGESKQHNLKQKNNKPETS
jgi:hypothetical protein